MSNGSIKENLIDALQITPVNNNNAFSSPPSSDALINFINNLGYPKVVRNLSKVVTNDMFQLGSTSSTRDQILYFTCLMKNLFLDISRVSGESGKHQRYLAGEKWSDPDSPTLKPAKATKKSNSSAPKADLRPPVTKPASSQQPELKPAPVNSLRSVDESVDEGIPEKEPRVDDEEADIQRAVKESLKSVYDVPRGSLPPVTPKKKSLANQFIYQRRTSTPTESSGHDEFSLLYVELGLTDSEVESNEDVPRINMGVQDEGQAGPNPGEQDEGQAGPNPDLEATDVSTQPHPEQIDKGFTATTYPKVHENLKLTVKEEVILEEPASSTRTLSSLQHLAKDLSFGDLFFNDKPSDADNEKTTIETEVEWCLPDSLNVHRPLQATTTKTTTKTTTTAHPPPPQPQQSTTGSMLMKRIGELEHIMANLIQDNKHLEDRHERDSSLKMWETNSYKAHEDHIMLYEALEKSMNCDHTNKLLKDLAEARKKKKKRRDSPKMPYGSPPHQLPPPPLPAGPSGTSGSPRASGSSQVPPPPPPPPSTNQEGRLSHRPLKIDDDMAPDAQVHSSDDEYIRNTYIPKNNWASALASTYSPPLEDSLLAQTGDMYQMKECHKLLTDSVDDSIIRHNVNKPLPLGGPPAQVTIQSDFFFNKDLEYLRYRSKGSRPTLSISKMKAAYYPDVGLEQMVPDQMWIKEECKHTSEGDHRAVRTHIRILSVVRIKVFSTYGYDYIKKIVLCRADLNEHIIAERDFKYLYPTDFEDLYLLNLQGHLNHLPPKDKKILTSAVNLWTRHLVIKQRVKDFQLGIESYQTQFNLTKPRWDAMGFEYKHDYMIIDSLRTVTFQDKYGVQMIMWFNEIYKFSDGTLCKTHMKNTTNLKFSLTSMNS
nr:hypothetical protein [Tanacetum cinerariifolium]